MIHCRLLQVQIYHLTHLLVYTTTSTPQEYVYTLHVWTFSEARGIAVLTGHIEPDAHRAAVHGGARGVLPFPLPQLQRVRIVGGEVQRPPGLAPPHGGQGSRHVLVLLLGCGMASCIQVIKSAAEEVQCKSFWNTGTHWRTRSPPSLFQKNNNKNNFC